MKLYIITLLSLFLVLAQNSAFAQSDVRSQLETIYQSYQQNPDQTCRELQNTLTSADTSQLNAAELKKAYYFLANCQYQLRELDNAVTYYSKVSKIAPKDPQPLIDAGSINVEQGHYRKARTLFKQALERASGNESETQRIRTIINNTPGQFQKKYTLSTSIGYDSNVNSGPKDNIHFIYDSFNYTLESDTKPRDDFFTKNSIGTSVNKALDSNTYFLFNLSGNHINYFEEADFNSTVISTSVGYQKIYGSKSVTLTPYVNYQTLNEDSYQITSGLHLAGAARVSDKINVWPSIGWFTQDFFENDSRDAHAFSLGNSASYKWNDKTSLVGSLFYTYSNADNDQFSYNNVFIDGRVTQKISEDLTATLGYALQLYYYRNPDPVFGSARKDDGHRVYLGFNYSLKKFFKKRAPSLNLSVSYNQNKSNHSFQESNRLFSALKLTFTF